jgi:hypothetical protein
VTQYRVKGRLRPVLEVLVVLALLSGGVATVWVMSSPRTPNAERPTDEDPPLTMMPRIPNIDDSGFTLAVTLVDAWPDGSPLEVVRQAFQDLGARSAAKLETRLADPELPRQARIPVLIEKAAMLLYEGAPELAYAELVRARAEAQSDRVLAAQMLSTVIFLQGVAALRRGETENCVMCRGEGSCIFPISREAIHQKPEGSRLAIRHFREYLSRHPDDLGVRWLLNLAHMTLGEYPDKVAPEYLLAPERFHSEPASAIGAFKDVGHLAGVNRLNMAGGAIMEDFDNDGLLDIVVSSMDTAMPLAFYRNKGDGTFEERGALAGLKDQLGGLYCVQTDYDNDGWMDIFVVRGAWLQSPIRPSLLRNNGDGTFRDVTVAAGLSRPVNAIVACWADFDNDGLLDLFVGCELGPNLLYRNKGDGTFEEVGMRAGVAGNGKRCKGASWGDFNGDGLADLFVNYLDGPPQLFRNNGDGTFTDVAAAMGVVAPTVGFSCWFWDHDNDGWLDIYASAYERDLDDVVRGMIGEPHRLQTGRLYRNQGGKGFQDVTKEAGLDMVLVPMGSNFADFDNDGYLDFYLGTGWPPLSALRPNRMFRNVAGKRFADITIPSRTGHLQKGHAVSCGDWRRCGSVDLFVQLGGASPGDRFHNVLFQNPGQGNRWLTVKLIGKKSNRAAIGARIKAVTAGETPLTVYRHVTSGSSFGANPLQQTIGLGKASQVATLEVFWPTSGTTQVFRDVPVNQAIEITEFATAYRPLNWQALPALREQAGARFGDEFFWCGPWRRDTIGPNWGGSSGVKPAQFARR